MISIRDAAQISIDAATGSEQCVGNAVSAWETGLYTAGVNIASCAEQSTSPIQNATEDFHDFVKQQSTIAFEAQNFILNVFTEV